MVKNKFPKQGDLIWINLDPVFGHEQGGRRPAVVISGNDYNKISGLMIICPVTSRTKDLPFEVSFNTEKISGSVLVDQVRCLDWGDSSRKCEIKGTIPSDILQKVCKKISKLIEIS